MFSLFKVNLTLPPVRLWRTSAILIEDQPTDALLMGRAMEGAGFRVVTVPTAEEALGVLHANGRHYPLVVTDISLTGMSGWVLHRLVRENFPKTMVVIVTGAPEALNSAPHGQLIPFIVKSANMQPAFRELHAWVTK